jgi:large subunit ribosomal protein L5
MNVMRNPRIEKVVVNIGVGEAGEKLIKAEKVLQLITDRKPVRTVSKTINKDWGVRKGMPIGCKVTLRGEKAEKFLKDAFWVRDNKIPDYSFDDNGNLSFGIPDYTDFPGMKYDPNIGILGMDVCVIVSRAGARVNNRKRCAHKIPNKHRMTYEETTAFVKSRFGVEVIE